MSRRVLSALCFIIIVFLVQTSFADQEETGWKARWEKLVEAAEREGEGGGVWHPEHRHRGGLA